MSRRLILFVLCCSCAAVFAPPASGAEFTQTHCGSYMGWDDLLWEDPVETDAWGASGCVDGYVNFVVMHQTTNEDPVAELVARTTAEITNVASYLWAPEAEGFELTLSVCRFNFCGTAHVIDQPFDYIDFRSFLGDESIPAGANRLKLKARCVIDICEPLEDTWRISSTVTMDDPTPPQLFNVYELDEEYQQVPPGPLRWQNGKLRYNLFWVDEESPVTHFRVTIDPIDVCMSMRDPYFYVPGCNMHLDSQNAPEVFASDLEDGLHTMTISIANAAGLSSSDTIQYLTDATKPRRPRSFSVDPSMNSWAGDRDVKISWENGVEEFEVPNERSGIEKFIYDIDPDLDAENPPDPIIDPPAETVFEEGADSLQVEVPGNGAWSVTVTTVDKAGNESAPGFFDFEIDDTVIPAPLVEPIAPLNIAAAETGRTIGWTTERAGASGLCGLDYAFSSAPVFNPGEDPRSPSLPGSVHEVELSPYTIRNLRERPQYFHLRPYSCSGVPGEIAHSPVVVDLTRPEVSVEPEAGTIADDEPANVKARDLREGTQQSGVERLDYSVNGGPTFSVSDVEVPLDLPDGTSTINALAVDAAGNESIVISKEMLVDKSPPTAWVEPASSDDPASVKAHIADSGSGVKSAAIQLRPVSGGSWLRIGDEFKTSDPAPGEHGLSATIPDDGTLPDGEYQLRVVAIDAAEHRTESLVRVDGSQATARLPLRAATNLTATIGRSAAQSRGVRHTAAFGESPQISGVLRDAAGNGVPAADIVITEIADTSLSKVSYVATTSANGSFAVNVPSGVSRRFVLSYAGDRRRRPAQSQLELFVRGQAALRVIRSRVKPKSVVYLRGSVTTAGAAIPPRGKSVRIEFKVNGRRSSLGRSAVTDAAGKFEVRFSHRIRPKSLRMSVRVVVPHEPTWPFETGASSWKEFVLKR